MKTMMTQRLLQRQKVIHQLNNTNIVPSGIQVIVGLGNPGPKYESTCHNVGFWFADALIQLFDGNFRYEQKFLGDLSKISVSGQEIWLLKPHTYMNHSGQSVSALLRFYKIPVENLLVVHDELDLPPGVVRLKQGGGHGGHNGLRDVISHLSDKNFQRLRIGIGHPGNSGQVVDYVLGRASKQEQTAIHDGMGKAIAVLSQIVTGDTQKAMNELHS